MKVRRPIMPNWSTTMLAGMFVTRPEKREILMFRATLMKILSYMKLFSRTSHKTPPTKAKSISDTSQEDLSGSNKSPLSQVKEKGEMHGNCSPYFHNHKFGIVDLSMISDFVHKTVNF